MIYVKYLSKSNFTLYLDSTNSEIIYSVKMESSEHLSQNQDALDGPTHHRTDKRQDHNKQQRTEVFSVKHMLQNIDTIPPRSATFTDSNDLGTSSVFSNIGSSTSTMSNRDLGSSSVMSSRDLGTSSVMSNLGSSTSVMSNRDLGSSSGMSSRDLGSSTVMSNLGSSSTSSVMSSRRFVESSSSSSVNYSSAEGIERGSDKLSPNREPRFV